MATANELLRDATISHQVDLSQYSTSVVRRMVALLNRVDADLVAALAVALERLDPDSFTVERLELVLENVRAINAQAYARIERELTAELRELADVEADAQHAMLVSAVPAQVATSITFVRVDPERVYVAAMARPFQGRLLRDWMKSLADTRIQKRMRDVIANGFVSGQSVDQIVRAIRGTRAQGYADGFLQRDRRELEVVVRTAIQHLASTVRDRTAEANADVVRGRQWLATLDLRTTEMCRIRDRLLYTNEDRPRPIGHSMPWLAGPGRIHWGCRSTSTLVLRSLADIPGVSIRDYSPTTRESMDGQVPAQTTYGEWLQRQSAARQDEVVGPTRGALMRQGKLPFDSFYTDRGQWLTLDDLRKRHPRAFSDAGL